MLKAGLVAATVALASSPAFAGGHAHGTAHQIPSVAAQYGYTKLAFFENWSEGLATAIDLNATLVQGFNWYTQNFFPVVSGYVDSNLNTGNTYNPYYTVPSSAFSLSNGVMIYAPVNLGANIWTCAWNGRTPPSSGTQLVGNSWGGGFYIDWVWQWDPDYSNTSGVWPTLWMLPIEFLNGGTGTSGHVIDISHFEANPNGGSSAFCHGNCAFDIVSHDDQSSNVVNQYDTDVSSSPMPSIFGTYQFVALNHYQFLWVPASKNGGTGLMQWFVNNQLVGSQTYSAAGVPSPALTPSNPTGALSYIDSQHFCLIVQTGSPASNQAIGLGAIQLWQSPP